MHSGERWKLGHRPGLDGLRGIAILAVVAYHGVVLAVGNGEAVPGLGIVGVGLFFTLSGFLITSLLLDEHQARGRIDLWRFYRRRALRLLPAVAVTVALVVAVGVVVEGYATVGSGLATLFYVQNWYSALGGGAQNEALTHTWSLAIEEQFYLVWPVVLIGLLRLVRTAVFSVAVLGAAASFLLRDELWSRDDAWRVYVGTDTRADGLLIGCALAVAIRHLSVNRSTLTAVGVCGAVSVAATALLDDQVYAPLTTSIGAVGLILLATQPGRVLELSWLRWFGQRSYGLYLWHIPVMLLVARAGWSPTVLLVVFAGASLALTVLSWRYVERPFLRLKDRRASGGVVVGVGAGV